MVNSRAEAEQAVSACKYPPQGTRGIGGIRTRLYGGPDYVEHANDEIAVIVQIEHIQAVENARDILSVPGIDAYFIGPGDLCASMGLPNTWNPEYPEFWAALDEVQRVARDLGVPGLHTSGERAADLIDRGYQFVAVGFDVSFMVSSAQAAVRAARRQPAAAW